MKIKLILIVVVVCGTVYKMRCGRNLSSLEDWKFRVQLYQKLQRKTVAIAKLVVLWGIINDNIIVNVLVRNGNNCYLNFVLLCNLSFNELLFSLDKLSRDIVVDLTQGLFRDLYTKFFHSRLLKFYTMVKFARHVDTFYQ